MASLTLVPLTLELDTNTPFNSTRAWNTIATSTTQGLISGTINRGRQFELDRIETGTASFTVLNTARNFDPDNTAGAYYPNLLPLRRVRLSAVYNATTYYLWHGFIESIKQNPVLGDHAATVTIDCVDGFEFLNLYSLSPSRAHGSIGNLTFTARGVSAGLNRGVYTNTMNGSKQPPGAGAGVASVSGPGLSVTINSQAPNANKPLTADFDPQAGQVNVYLATDASGQTSSSDGDVAGLLNSSQAAHAMFTKTGSGGRWVKSNGSTTLGSGGFPAERSDQRVARCLSEANWPSGERALDTGVQTVQAIQFEKKDGVKALAHIQDVVAAELGVFFQKHGSAATMTFQNRTHRTTAPGNTVQATFSDAPTGGEFPYTDLQASYDLTRLYNSVSVTMQGSDTTQTASDSTSKTRYGTRDYTATLLLDTDANAATIAAALLARYKDPKTRFDQITVRPWGLSNGLWAHALGREISDVIRIKRTPPGGGPQINVTCYIEAVQHTFDPSGWSTSWQLSPV